MQMNPYAMECERWGRNRQCISPREMTVSNQMRMLWEQHVYWTRMFISGAVFKSPDVKFTEARLLRNPKDFAQVLRPVYGEKKAEEFETLFTEHLTIAGQLVTAAVAGDTEKANTARQQWYENADRLAVFLAEISPCWTFEEWQEMMDSHLAMTEQEAMAFIMGNYEESIAIFASIEQEALEMADMMTAGIMMQ